MRFSDMGMRIDDTIDTFKGIRKCAICQIKIPKEKSDEGHWLCMDCFHRNKRFIDVNRRR